MILETMGDMVFLVVTSLLEFLPDVSWSVNEGILDDFFEFLECACYFFPMEFVSTLLSMVLVFHAFKIGVSLLRTLWDLLPLV